MHVNKGEGRELRGDTGEALGYILGRRNCLCNMPQDAGHAFADLQ